MTRTVLFCSIAMLTIASPRAQQPAAGEGWVVLALDDYHALRARAFPAAPDPPSPPVDATLTRIDYDLRAEGTSATGQARLTIDVLKQGWAAVQVPGGVLVRGVRLDGQPIALVDDTPPRVLLSRPGRSVLTLDIVVPVASAAATGSLSLPAAGSVVSALTLVVPRAGLELAPGRALVSERSETPTETRWVVHAAPQQPIALSWKRRIDDQRVTMPIRARARITQLVTLAEESAALSANVRAEIVQGAARDIVLSVPADVLVNQVAGASVADWTHESGVLRVALLEPATGVVGFVVSAETRTPREGAIPVPLIRLAAAERETGGVAVDVAGPGEIAARTGQGLDPMDPAELGDVLAGRESPSMRAFRFRPMPGNGTRALAVTVSRYAPQAVLVANVEEARYDAVAGEDGKLLVRARYAVRNNQRSFLAVTLPPHATMWSAELAGRPVRPGVSSGGNLLVPLQKGRAGQDAPTFAVELVYLQHGASWADRGTAAVTLPAVDLPVSRTALSLQHSPRFRVDPKPGLFRVAPDAGPYTLALRENETTGAMTALPPPPGQPDEVLADAQSLLERLDRDAGRLLPGVMPVKVLLPDVGPAIFVAAELIAESRAPALDLEYRRVER